jgi:hypothetical protein
MYYVYGSHTHPPNEVNIVRYEKRRIYSPRKKRVAISHRHFLRVDLKYDSQALLTAAILELIQAYENNGQDCRFYQDNGDPTPHGMVNADTLSGVRVENFDWISGDAAEYATQRTALITVACEYEDVESQIWDWTETFRYTGDCGPAFSVARTWDGPVSYQTSTATEQHIVQRGRAIGWGGYPTPPDPFFSGAGIVHHRDRAVVVPGTPKLWGNSYRLYPVEWAYFFTVGTDQSGNVPPPV